MGNNFNTGDTVVAASVTSNNTYAEGVNLSFGTTTGTKLGTATTQKLGFFNATPVVQEAGSNDVLASLVTLGLRAASSNPPLDIGTGTLSAGLAVFANATAGQSGRMSVNTGGLGLNGGTSFTDSGANGGGWLRLYGNSHASLAGRVIISAGDIVTTGIVSLQARGNEVLTIGLNSCTAAEGVNFILGTTTGTKFGTATSEKLAFHNATPVIQRANASQAAVVATGSALASYGYTQAQADSIVTLVNELRAAMVEKGLIKGSA